VALSSSCSKDTQKSSLEPPNQSEQQTSKLPWQHASSFGSSWAVDDFLQFSDIEEATDKVIRSFCMDSIMSPIFCLQTILPSKGMKKLGESGLTVVPLNIETSSHFLLMHFDDPFEHPTLPLQNVGMCFFVPQLHEEQN
jgi:hypothetical protein